MYLYNPTTVFGDPYALFIESSFPLFFFYDDNGLVMVSLERSTEDSDYSGLVDKVFFLAGFSAVFYKFDLVFNILILCSPLIYLGLTFEIFFSWVIFSVW